MSLRENRRTFLKKSSSMLALGAAATSMSQLHLFGANQEEKITLGLIGCGGIMQHHIRQLIAGSQNVVITHLCDVDPAQIEKSAKLVESFQQTAPQQTQRYEDVLEDKNVDAVLIATPHHWHAPMGVAAMQAGKDVYLEKPISHVYAEGQLIKDAALKYDRVVQQGSQMRNSPVTAEAEKLLRSGIIGEIKVARAWTAEARTAVKPVPDSEPPAGVDYDRWLGPAPKHAFNPHRFHFFMEIIPRLWKR
ncbi:MAG: Gfo/Idh/MocA family oxidoreductase [Planctomycetaceae bacterium]